MPTHHRTKFRAPLRLEALEDRSVPATFTVTNLNDAGPGSLRDAIAQANDEGNHPGADTIVFDSTVKGGTVGLMSFTNLPDSSDPSNPQPVGPTALVITSDVTIQGTGETITRSGTTPFRLFQVTAAGTLTLQNLTLSNGLAQGGSGSDGGGGAAGLGGAVYNQGTLRVFASTLTNNQAVGGAGDPNANSGGGGGLGGPGAPNSGGPGSGGNGGGPNGGTNNGSSFTDAGFGGGGSSPFDGGFGGGGGDSGNGGFGGGAGTGESGGFGGGDGFGSGSSFGGGGGAGMGGAIFNQGGTLALVNATVFGNTARGGDSPAATSGGGFGGGLFNLNGSVTLTNATFAGNTVAAGTGSAAGSTAGGALYNLSFLAEAFPGGPAATSGTVATIAVVNSILANSTGAGDVFNNQQATSAATINATGPNIVSVAVTNNGGTVSGTAFTIANPNLGPLQNNGGPTPTAAPQPGSPAIDAGDNAAAGLPTTDQRGFNRVVNNRVDLGAVEFQPSGTTTTLTSSLNPSPLGQSVTFTATVTANAPGSNVPQGTVTFSDGGNPLATVQLTNGQASFTTSALTAGSHAVTARYDGFALGAFVFDPSSASVTQVVNAPPNPLAGLGVLGVRPGHPPIVTVLNGDGSVRLLIHAYEDTFLGGVQAELVFVGGRALVVTTPWVGGGGLMKIFDALTGDFVFGTLLLEDTFRGGMSLTTNGTRAFMAPAAGGGPRLIVFDLASMSVIYDNFVLETTLRGGLFLKAADFDGDGKVELAVGPGDGGGPRVQMIDAETFEPLKSFFAGDPTRRNGTLVGAGDLLPTGWRLLLIGPGNGEDFDGTFDIQAHGDAVR